jgi:hypothetical protein
LYLQEIAELALGVQTRNVDFIETYFTRQTDFIFVRYATTNESLPNNNRFRFQSNVIKVSCVGDKVREMSLHRFILFYLTNLSQLLTLYIAIRINSGSCL